MTELANSGPGEQPGPRITGVRLPDYPWVHNGFPSLGTVMTEAPDTLDALAREYGATTTTPSIEEFFLWWLQNRLNEYAYRTYEPATGSSPALDLQSTDGLAAAMWLGHLSGYVMGIWFRTNMRRFNPWARLAPRRRARDASFAPLVSYLERVRSVALSGSAEEVADYNLASLRGPKKGPGKYKFSGSNSGEVVMYGYDAGYTRALLSIKTKSHPPARPYLDYSTEHLLDATYHVGDLPFLTKARTAYASAGAGDGDAARRLTHAVEGEVPGDHLLALTDKYQKLGYRVWSLTPFVSVRRWSQEEYERALLMSAYFIQHSQANALAGIAAYAGRDTELGRQQVAGTGLFQADGSAFVVVFLDRQTDRIGYEEASPHFTFEPGA